jgi:hypothetical protein
MAPLFKGRFQSGQMGQTVNLLRKLRRFESCSPHAARSERKLFCGEHDTKVLQNVKGNGINAGVAQLVEHQPSKLRVAGSSLVSRSIGGLAVTCFAFAEHQPM